jgi:hypothetical protein
MNPNTVPPNGARSQAPSSFPTPPGFLGVLADALLDYAYKPIPEIANLAAVMSMAGVAGRAFRTPTGKDTSMYAQLIADSGIGKDVIHEGIPELFKLGGGMTGAADRFLNQDTFASGIALQKAVANSPGFLTLQPEWGRQLIKMNNGDVQAEGLRTKLTEFSGKSRVGGQRYSDATNNVRITEYPALSFLGETTPSTFLASLTDDMAEDGFLSRFVTVWYEGNRPQSCVNDDRRLILTKNELDYWCRLIAHCLKWAPVYDKEVAVNDPGPPIMVQATPEERANFISFESSCDDEFNKARGNPHLQHTWSRAHIKALRLASLCAIADNFERPVITVDHATWAREIVKLDQGNYARQERIGAVGSDDHSRTSRLVNILREYMSGATARGYKVNEKMHNDNVVPHSYMQIRLQRSPQFIAHKLGANAGLNHTIKTFLDSGYFKEIERAKAMIDYNFRGKCYMIVDLPTH